MKIKVIFFMLLTVMLLDCTISAAIMNANNNENYNTFTSNSYNSTQTPYVTYNPDGWSGAPYLQFYGGEINDPEYLATHIIWKENSTDTNVTTRTFWTEQDIFVPHEDGWRFIGVSVYNFQTGSYNFSDKTTYFVGNATAWPKIEFFGGPYTFSNATIHTDPDGVFAYLPVTALQNSVFYNISNIRITDTPTENFEVYNITFIDRAIGIFKVKTSAPFNNSSFHDMYFERARGFGGMSNATYSSIYNISANGTLPNNSNTGLVFGGGGTKMSDFEKYTGGHHNKAWNITLSCTDRSGFDLTGFEHDFYGEDIYVNGSGHNCVDLHGQYNVTLVNVTARNSLMENFMITTGDLDPDPYAQESDLHIHNRTGYINERNLSTVSHNVSIYNLMLGNASGSDLAINRFIDAYFENVTTYNTRSFINANYYENLTIVNATVTDATTQSVVTLGTLTGTHKQEGYANDTKFVDFLMSGKGTVKPYIWLFNARNTSLVNYYSTGMSGTGISFYNGRGCDYTKYYYPNLKVVDLNGNPVKGAIVTVNDTSRNGYGEVQTEYRTDEKGKLYDKGNRSNWLAVPDEFRNDSGYVYYTPEIKATSGKYTNSIVVNPDSTWYSQDPSDLQGPEVVLTLNVKDPDDPCVLPYVNFTSNVTNGCVPLVVQFNDTSTESPYAWAWDFENDGIIDSTVKNPVHTYFTKGNYTVRLAVINNAGSNTTTKSNYIIAGANITIQKLAANFSSNVTSGNAPLNVSFTDTSTGVPVKWNWNFGDGTVNSTVQNPSHTYETAGVYTVTLTVTDTNCNTDSHTCIVTVLEKLEATKVHILSPNITLPGKTFTVNLLVDPSTPIIGTQLDFIFNSSMVSANSASEGDLFKQKGSSTFFNEGDINSSGGTIKHIYGLIIGTSNVSSPGTFATVNLTAGNKTGMAEFSLSNVLISDINSKSVPYTVTNATVLIDTAPVIDPICCPKSVDEKSNLAFKISAKDADGDRLTLSASGLPEGSSFNRTSGAFSWTPAVGQAGVYTITFKVSDGYLTDSENATVTVNKLNNPPVINFFEPINGSSFSEGERIGISVNATDAEKQALNYSIKIDGVMYSSNPAYIWETDYSSSGNHTIEVSVSDGIDEAKMQHSIYISECHPRYDVNEDGVVNILDITNVSREYETTVSKPYPRYDTNQDGEINILDLTLVGHHFGEKVE